MSDEKTTIRVSKAFVERLESYKVHRRELAEEALTRILDEYDKKEERKK